MNTRAQLLANTLGPLLVANDSTNWELAAAQANYNLLCPGWCRCVPQLDQAYFRDQSSGSHGWLCTTCRKITQLG